MHSIIPIYQVYLLAELNYKRFMYKKLCILLTHFQREHKEK